MKNWTRTLVTTVCTFVVVSAGCSSFVDTGTISGKATWSNGTPVGAQAMDLTVTIEGAGDYENNTIHTSYNGVVVGTISKSVQIDSASTYKDFFDLAQAHWWSSEVDYRGIDPQTVQLDTVNNVLVQAALSVNETNCNYYCDSYTKDYCASWCTSHTTSSGSTTTCQDECSKEQWTSCGTRCMTSKKIIASATVYPESFSIGDTKTDNRSEKNLELSNVDLVFKELK